MTTTDAPALTTLYTSPDGAVTIVERDGRAVLTVGPTCANCGTPTDGRLCTWCRRQALIDEADALILRLSAERPAHTPRGQRSIRVLSRAIARWLRRAEGHMPMVAHPAA